MTEKPISRDARLAHIRHEIRNSLNVLTGALRLLEMSKVTPQQQKHVDMCRGAIDKISATLETADSGYSDTERAREAAAELRALGGVSFLTKPFERSDLLRTVQLAGGSRRTLRLLSADDVPEVRWLLGELLANSRCTVEFVPDGKAAVERAKSGEFDVILLDLDMPVMDGREAARGIRRREERDGRPPVPIVVVTGHNLEQALEGADVDDDADTKADPAIEKLVPEYLANRRADLDALRMHIENGAWDRIKAIGHKMKGTGRGYGMPRISEIGRALEGAGADRDTGRARAGADALEAFLERVNALRG
jgi:CheY-like chemotaxis protein